MKLRRPQETLADCCWLPRLADKVRASRQGNFPLLYRLSLGSPIGIDGFFLRHFKIPFRQFRVAVLQTGNDASLVKWFLSQPRVNPTTIGTWNELGPRLGTPGCPGSLLRRVIPWVVYPKALKHPVTSFFEMIEQDEAP